MVLDVLFCLTNSLKYSIYSDIQLRKAEHPHIGEAGIGKYLVFLPYK